MQETRTARIATDRLRAAGFEVTNGVGKTGVVGVLRNGDGPVIMLRADMDALAVHEETGLAYTSKETATDSTGKQVPVMHACGHDMHVTWLIGAATVLAQTRETCTATLMPVFQPTEETGAGAQAMIDDGLMSRFPKPDAVLGQHVMVGPAGAIGGRTGVITSAADSLQILLFGRGAQGSMPQAAIDRYSLVSNDPDATRRVVESFRAHFPADRVRETRPTSASEDFGSFGMQWHAPSVFWFVGGTDPSVYNNAKASGRLSELPTNHNPRFAPVVHPTLETGVGTLVVASRAWLAR